MAPSYKETRFKRMNESFIASSRNSQSGRIDPSRPPGDIAEIHPEIVRALNAHPGMDKPYDHYKEELPDSIRYEDKVGRAVTVAEGITELIKTGVSIKDSFALTAKVNELVRIREAAIEQLPANKEYVIQVYNLGQKDQSVEIYPQEPTYGPGLWPKAHLRFERGTNPNPVMSPHVVVYGEGKPRFARVYDGTAADKEPYDITKHGGEVPADAKFDHEYSAKREPGKLA